MTSVRKGRPIRHWTTPEIDHLTRLVDLGETNPAIAAKLGRSVNAIETKRRMLRKTIANSATPLTTAEKEVIHAMVENETPIEQIAAALSRSANCVARYCESKPDLTRRMKAEEQLKSVREINEARRVEAFKKQFGKLPAW